MNQASALGDGDELAGARVIEAGRALAGSARAPSRRRGRRSRMSRHRDALALVHVDVGDLVVGDRKRRAAPASSMFAAQLLADREQAALAERAVEVDGRDTS